MPNWCDNSLTIQGTRKELSKLRKEVEITNSEATDEHGESVFSCHKVIPRPTSEDQNWYDWNITNWGSKWDIKEVWRNEDWWETGELNYTFLTAWSPVVDVVATLSAKYKSLTFTYTYSETGSDYWGEHEYKKGKEVSCEGGAISSAGCERQEYLIGDHHCCHDCGNEIVCEGDKTPNLCADCVAYEDEEDIKLWEGEADESETKEQVEVA
jgi:hypothetical protein